MMQRRWLSQIARDHLAAEEKMSYEPGTPIAHTLKKGLVGVVESTNVDQASGITLYRVEWLQGGESFGPYIPAYYVKRISALSVLASI